MKFTIFILLFVGIRFVHAETNLIDSPSTLVSSVGGLVKDATSLLNNPVDGASGLLFLAPGLINLTGSIQTLSRSVDDFSRFIIAQPDAITILTKSLSCFFNYLNDLIVASYHFSRAIEEQTDEHGNVNFFNFSDPLKAVNELAAAYNGLSSCIQPNINGGPDGLSTKSLKDIAEKIKETSVAQATLAAVADNVHGITGLVAGIAALLFDVAASYGKLSTSLPNFSGAITNLSESSSLSDLINAVNDLAQSEHQISEAFYGLSKL